MIMLVGGKRDGKAMIFSIVRREDGTAMVSVPK